MFLDCLCPQGLDVEIELQAAADQRAGLDGGMGRSCDGKGDSSRSGGDLLESDGCDEGGDNDGSGGGGYGCCGDHGIIGIENMMIDKSDSTAEV